MAKLLSTRQAMGACRCWLTVHAASHKDRHQEYLKGADHLLLSVVRDFGGAIGALQKGDQL